MLIFAFICWVASKIIDDAAPLPTQFSLWLIIPAVFICVVLVVVFFFLRFIWNNVESLRDSWNTHYALTDRRFLIVSRRGVIEYDASYFRKMEALDGKPGAQILLFDWGPTGKRQIDVYRDRLAALPDAHKLERLIRDTLRA